MIPESLLYPIKPFVNDFRRHHELGVDEWSRASVAVVGLARNCARWLGPNLGRLQQLVASCSGWQLHIETNDNSDGTDQVLMDFCAANRQATFTSQRLGRQQFSSEFAGRRTEALAEYRTNCQRWVRENASNADYVVVLDFDMWGGWSHAGLMHGVGSLATTPDAYGVASVSVMEWQTAGQWLHYDAWALRLNAAWDDYTAGLGGWKHSWLPAVGSPLVPVCSAFGGMAIYRTADYLTGTYDGSDCEHVPFHSTIAERTGRRMYIDPAMRTIMYWLERSDAGEHGSN